MAFPDSAFDPASPVGWHAALAALEWQVDLGATDLIGDDPVDAFALPERMAQAAPAGAAKAVPAAVAVPDTADPVAVARAAAAGAATLQALHQAIAAYDLCELKKGARNTVFADGNPRARVLVLGEAPGAEEDREGRPFVGRAGQLLDRMFAAIGLSRRDPDTEKALYITNVMFWRPPGNRDPLPAEVAMMMPFVERHIALVDPDVVVLMGNTPLSAATGAKGITRARGQWIQAFGKPALPMFHPAYLLRNPGAKREGWADLLALQARVQGQWAANQR